jgi:predicted DsbA family dithiol-disulfide isomerase
MKNRFIGLLLLAGVGSVWQGCARIPGFAKKSDVAAQVGARKITVSEIDDAIKPELAKIESERYEARKVKLDQLIDDALLAEKAKSLGITKDELIQREITDKSKLPTEADVKATFDKFKSQAGGAAFDVLAPRIKEMLTTQATNARRAEFMGELRKEAKISINISPPRFQVDTALGHAEGATPASIVFIEFSDYQCPFCGRSQDTVKKVLDKYDGKILHVFMDFPLTAIHPQAMPAAVASHCAEEQGKYDEYHKLLFDKQRELSSDNLKKWAGELGLDQSKFEACLTSGKYEPTIKKSVEAGQKVGISGTPGFFVNGIAIKGAQPFEVFQKTIDEELARAK